MLLTKSSNRIFALICGLTICACHNTSSTNISFGTITLKPIRNNYVPLHSDVKNYLADDYKSISVYARGNEEKSQTQVKLAWKASFENNIELVGNYTVLLSNDYNFETHLEKNTADEYAVFYDIDYNLEYYWKIAFNYKEKTSKKVYTYESEIEMFNTISSTLPMFYTVDYVTNFRDLGNLPTNDNQKIKTGMLYRSGRLDNISSIGIQKLKNLNIKTEIDLRDEKSYTTSPALLEQYYSVPMHSSSSEGYKIGWTDTDYITKNISGIYDIFSYLADTTNYPINFHCAIGTDRTGVISFLLEALLDVKQEWLYRDYLFSNFGNIGSARSHGVIDIYIDYINANSAGDTLSEKTFNYLKNNVNLTDEKLNNVISLLKTTN